MIRTAATVVSPLVCAIVVAVGGGHGGVVDMLL